MNAINISYTMKLEILKDQKITQMICGHSHLDLVLSVSDIAYSDNSLALRF